MSKSGEAWLQSAERRILERAIIAPSLPLVGGLAASAAGVLLVAERGAPVVTTVNRSLYPGHSFYMRKLGDPDRSGRVTELFRKAMIDELPQALDILRGSMSLIGPRADKPAHIDRLFGAIEDEDLRDRWQEARARQKPGIISSYAIHSHAHNLEGLPEYVRFSEEELLVHNATTRAVLDIQDFEQASLGHDLHLLGATGRMVASNYGHYAQRLLLPNVVQQTGET